MLLLSHFNFHPHFSSFYLIPFLPPQHTLFAWIFSLLFSFSHCKPLNAKTRGLINQYLSAWTLRLQCKKRSCTAPAIPFCISSHHLSPWSHFDWFPSSWFPSLWFPSSEETQNACPQPCSAVVSKCPFISFLLGVCPVTTERHTQSVSLAERGSKRASDRPGYLYKSGQTSSSLLLIVSREEPLAIHCKGWRTTQQAKTDAPGGRELE